MSQPQPWNPELSSAFPSSSAAAALLLSRYQDICRWSDLTLLCLWSLVSLDSGLELEVLGGFPPTETGWQSCMTPPSSTDTDAIVSLLWTFSVNLLGQTRLQCENIAGLPSFQWNVSSEDSYIWLPTIRMTFWRGSAWLRFLINSLCFPCILANSMWLRTNMHTCIHYVLHALVE